MKVLIRRQLARLVDILSMLEHSPEKGCVWGLNRNLPTESSGLKTAIRLLKESAKSFRESFLFLQASRRCFARCLRNLANSIAQRNPFRGHIFAARQPQTQTSHPSQDSHSCTKSDVKNEEVSND